jgi:hypothetical protein
MIVKELIKELKKMPQDMIVGVSMFDSSEGEIAGWVNVVYEVEEIQDDKKTGRIVVDLHC